MVCPVYDYKARSREVYLPSGCGWYDFYTGKYYEGGQIISAEAPYERIPLYVKEGSIIPVGPAVEYALQSRDEEFTIWVYGGKDAKFSLYEDENLNYNYEKENFSGIEFNYSEIDKKLSVGERRGSFEGMVRERKINFINVSRDNPRGFDPDAESSGSINYMGQALVTALD
jgi:alpha-D-xyloside xylohydrolase